MNSDKNINRELQDEREVNQRKKRIGLQEQQALTEKWRCQNKTQKFACENVQ